MKIKTFDNIDQIHQIWNNSTWIRYNIVLNEMGMIDLTPEQEEALFPEVPDYFIIDGKVYKPTIADHVEYYGRKVDECSYYRITLNETTDSDTLNEVNEQLRKEGREELKQHTEAWLNKLRKTHPWIEENRLVLRVQYEDGQIDNACITMNSKVIALMDKEHPDTTDVEDWLNQLAQYKTFIQWIVRQLNWTVNENAWLPHDITNIRMTKPIELIESNIARVVIIVGRMDKTYKVKVTKNRDSDYIEATVEFPVENGFVASVGPSTQVKCGKGTTLSETFCVQDNAQIKYILNYGIKRAYTTVREANENCRTNRLKEVADRENLSHS